MFNIEDNNHKRNMDELKQSVMDGSSNWAAKITITGLFCLKKTLKFLRRYLGLKLIFHLFFYFVGL